MTATVPAGWVPPCMTCHGTGVVVSRAITMTVSVTCGACRGTGVAHEVEP